MLQKYFVSKIVTENSSETRTSPVRHSIFSHKYGNLTWKFTAYADLHAAYKCLFSIQLGGQYVRRGQIWLKNEWYIWSWLKKTNWHIWLGSAYKHLSVDVCLNSVFVKNILHFTLYVKCCPTAEFPPEIRN